MTFAEILAWHIKQATPLTAKAGCIVLIMFITAELEGDGEGFKKV